MNALESRARSLPFGVGQPFDDPDGPFVLWFEVPCLQPIPDGVLGTAPEDPAVLEADRSSLRLAVSDDFSTTFCHALVDEYRIIVCPELVGRGTELFTADTVPAQLRLPGAEAPGLRSSPATSERHVAAWRATLRKSFVWHGVPCCGW